MFNSSVIKTRRQQLNINKNLAEKADYIFRWAEEIIVGMLGDIDLSFIQKILIIGNRGNFPLHSLETLIPKAKIIIFEEDDLESIDFHQLTEIDLIISFCDINWLTDIEGFFHLCYNLLANDGIIIGGCIGGESLINLKTKLIEFEGRIGQKHYSHISPMLKAQGVTALLQNSNFKNIIVRADKLTVEYSSVMKLMRDLQLMGETNALIGNSGYIISKQLYQLIINDIQAFEENFEFISFAANKIASFPFKKLAR